MSTIFGGQDPDAKRGVNGFPVVQNPDADADAAGPSTSANVEDVNEAEPPPPTYEEATTTATSGVLVGMHALVVIGCLLGLLG